MAWTNPYYIPYTGYINPQYQSTSYPAAQPPTQQTAVPLQQQGSNGNMLTVFVDTEAEVNDYPVAAGTTVQLISFKLNKFWLKSTATNGVPQPIRSFAFSEETPKIQNEPNSVTRQEFDDLNRKLDKLLKELGGEG